MHPGINGNFILQIKANYWFFDSSLLKASNQTGFSDFPIAFIMPSITHYRLGLDIVLNTLQCDI